MRATVKLSTPLATAASDRDDSGGAAMLERFRPWDLGELWRVYLRNAHFRDVRVKLTPRHEVAKEFNHREWTWCGRTVSIHRDSPVTFLAEVMIRRGNWRPSGCNPGGAAIFLITPGSSRGDR